MSTGYFWNLDEVGSCWFTSKRGSVFQLPENMAIVRMRPVYFEGLLAWFTAVDMGRHLSFNNGQRLRLYVWNHEDDPGLALGQAIKAAQYPQPIRVFRREKDFASVPPGLPQQWGKHHQKTRVTT